MMPDRQWTTNDRVLLSPVQAVQRFETRPRHPATTRPAARVFFLWQNPQPLGR